MILNKQNFIRQEPRAVSLFTSPTLWVTLETPSVTSCCTCSAVLRVSQCMTGEVQAIPPEFSAELSLIKTFLTKAFLCRALPLKVQQPLAFLSLGWEEGGIHTSLSANICHASWSPGEHCVTLAPSCFFTLMTILDFLGFLLIL